MTEARSLRVSIVAAIAIISVSYAVFCWSLLQARKGDISRFVIAGGPGVDPSAVPPGLTVIPNIGGYDGATFYRLALDPFTRSETAYGITLDNPPYRQQRIVYPILVWLLSLGQAGWVPTLLVLVNLAALIALGVFGVLLARASGVGPLWGITFAFYPGYLMSLSRDTCEIVAIAFTVGGLAAIVRRRPVLAAASLAAAVLTRETALITVVMLCVADVLRRLSKRARTFPAAVYAAPLVAFAAWQLILKWMWGSLPVRAGLPQFAVPFSQFVAFFAASLSRESHLQRVYFFECVFLALVVVVAAVSAARRDGAPLEWRLAWLGNLALGVILPAAMWAEDFSFFRVLADLFATGVAVVVPAPVWARAALLAATAALWYYLAGHIVSLA